MLGAHAQLRADLEGAGLACFGRTGTESLQRPAKMRRQEMTLMGSRPLVQPGEAAPDFAVPAVHREGTVSLADYRDRSPLLLALYRGLY